MKMLHIVAFKLDESVDEPRIQKVMRLFNDCVGVISGLEWVQWGKNKSKSNYAREWDINVLMLFRDKESRDAYLPHPRHRQITKEVKGFYTDMMVFDQEVDPAHMFSGNGPLKAPPAVAQVPHRPAKNEGDAEMRTGRPVETFPMEFSWNGGDMEFLFDRQIELLKEDVDRAKAEDKLVVYLSCPISARGGGYHGTNVEIAKHAQRRLMTRWGHRFWILNPAMYQMESKEGRGLMRSHARRAWGDDADRRLEELPKVSGGDYMRMWTKVLVEDRDDLFENTKVHLGRNFDAYYFLGPSDIQDFFLQGGGKDLTTAIEEGFAQSFAMDPDFRDAYSVAGIEWDAKKQTPTREPDPVRDAQRFLRDEWEERRKRFFRYYSLRASTNFSLGSHDEWNIFVLLNQLRLEHLTDGTMGDVGELLPGYFDGRQIDLGGACTKIAPGYALQQP